MGVSVLEQVVAARDELVVARPRAAPLRICLSIWRESLARKIYPRIQPSPRDKGGICDLGDRHVDLVAPSCSQWA